MLKKILKIVGDNTPISAPIDDVCCSCNNPLDKGGVKFSAIFSKSTFNLNHDFYMNSDYICNHCAVFFKRENWVLYCERSGKSPNFPGKTSIANWMFFSHAFSNGNHEIVYSRQRWRELLEDPPAPPFNFIITTMGKKHLIHKSAMSYDRENFIVNFEGVTIPVNRMSFKTLIGKFEVLYSMGLSKESIKTGDYKSSATMKIKNKDLFYELDDYISEYRRKKNSWLEICEFIAKKQ